MSQHEAPSTPNIKQDHTARNKCTGIIAAMNPEEAVLMNVISSVYEDLDKIILVDNDSTNFSTYVNNIKSNFPNITVIHNLSNIGLTAQLNQGINHAISEGSDMVLILTQDTIMRRGGLKRMLKFYEENKNLNIGVLGANSSFRSDSNPKEHDIEFSVVKMLMSTAIVVPTNIFLAVGSYREDFFIYHEDDEFCYRVRKSGYQVILLNNEFTKHREGDAMVKMYNPIGLRRTYVPARKPNMVYYVIRNGTYFSLYETFSFLPASLLVSYSNVVSSIVHYRQPLLTLKFALIGMYHGLKGRLGKYDISTP